MSDNYDGRHSDLCKDECNEGTCTPSLGDPYGCGCCCGCLGGCVRGYEEQMVEQQSAASKPLLHEQDIVTGSDGQRHAGWVEQDTGRVFFEPGSDHWGSVGGEG